MTYSNVDGFATSVTSEGEAASYRVELVEGSEGRCLAKGAESMTPRALRTARAIFALFSLRVALVLNLKVPKEDVSPKV